MMEDSFIGTEYEMKYSIGLCVLNLKVRFLNFFQGPVNLSEIFKFIAIAISCNLLYKANSLKFPIKKSNVPSLTRIPYNRNMCYSFVLPTYFYCVN